MGLEIEVEEFPPGADARFAARLQENLEALAIVLERPGFGEGPASLGAEMELSLVDDDERPLPRNLDVLGASREPRLAVELNRFNLEVNARPQPLAGAPFTATAAELTSALGRIAEAAAGFGGHPVTIGILPTLREDDLQGSALTDSPRFRALSARLRAMRGAPFHVRIEGPESLSVHCDDVTLEGANTSMQVHLRVPPRDFARLHDAAQIATGPALAVAGNSPFVLDRLLWEESRVALFRQAVDGRDPSETWRPARVGFGHGWMREGALELFAETVALHAPLLPVVGDEDAVAVARAGGVPRLDELCLHSGTVWRWNRPVYDPAGGGHLRLEMRALPSGPTVPDMAANAAFLVGLTLGLADEVPWMTAALPFRYAEHNFVAAARRGLAATMLWPHRTAPSPRPVHAMDLVAAMLPVAARGLRSAGVDPAEADTWLGIIRERAAGGRTGASWMRAAVARLEVEDGRHEAVRRMLGGYRENAARGEPVHTWPSPRG